MTRLPLSNANPTRLAAVIALLIAVSACGTQPTDTAALPATATLAPVVSMTPRFTATPVPSRTPMPSPTFTPSSTLIPPSPTDTYTASPTPPVIGSVYSVQSVNIRSGPGTEYDLVEVLRPASPFEVLGRNNDENWLNIRLDDGREGWISAALVRLEPSATPLPTLTPSPDYTALALGTPLPTALLGGGTVTATPPRAVVTPTLPGTPDDATPTQNAIAALPNLDAINLTATALVSGLFAPTVTPIGFAPTTGASATADLPGSPATFAPTAGGASPVTPPADGTAIVRTGIDVYVRCDNPADRLPAPNNLAAGSSVEVYWFWYAATEAQIREHLDTVTYEVTLDGERIANYRAYASTIRPSGNAYVIDWHVPTAPLTAGTHTITYRATWVRPISDGFARFGPGTENVEETGTCTFVVR